MNTNLINRVQRIENISREFNDDEIPQWAIDVVQQLMRAKNRVCKYKGQKLLFSKEDIGGNMALEWARNIAQRNRTLKEYYRKTSVRLAEKLNEALRR